MAIKEYEGLKYFALWLTIIHCISKIIQIYNKRNKVVWFKLHSITNCISLVFALPDTVDFFCEPLHPARDALSFQPMYIIMSLHLYHILASTTFFGNFKLNSLDWIHHIIMCAILCFPFFDHTAIEFSNALTFFVNGLPGAIDYWLIAQVYEGRISQNQEKHWNSYLNVYLRSPGILYLISTGYIRYKAGLYGNPYLLIISTVILFWNAQFFMQIVVYSYGKSKKMPKISSMPDLRQTNY